MISFSILPLLLPPLPVFRLLLVCCSCCFLLAVATSSFSHYGVCYEIVCEYYPFLHESIFVVYLSDGIIRHVRRAKLQTQHVALI